MIAKATWVKTFFERERRPGDLVFAILFLLFSVFLVSQIGTESKWIKGTKLFTQPMFWPAVSLIGMMLFSICHVLGAVFSSRSDGRLSELFFWIRSIEYAIWFMVYVWIVPIVGYLPSTLFFALLLTLS